MIVVFLESIRGLILTHSDKIDSIQANIIDIPVEGIFLELEGLMGLIFDKLKSPVANIGAFLFKGPVWMKLVDETVHR